MALIPEPIFYERIRRGHGARRRLLHIRNTDRAPVKLTVASIDKPEWVDLEGVFDDAVLEIPGGGRVGVVANVNTSHKFFPRERYDDKLVVKLADKSELVIQITLHVTEIVEPFRGVFAIDFGTTSSCYAFKGTAADAAQRSGEAPSGVSPEIPSAIYFHDVRERDYPRYTIGNKARHDIAEAGSLPHAYALSVKRTLGSGQTYHVLDRWAGSRRGHQQAYSPEEVAGFVVKELICRAEDELDRRIEHVVATFPPMFSQDRKQGLQRAIELAFKGLGRDVKPERIVLGLDEATAATFTYIYGPMLDGFRRFQTTKDEKHLLAFDFGGGTIDIALVTARIERQQGGRIAMRTELRGLSGEADFGGDNVTLAVLKIVRARAALRIAEERLAARIEAEKKARAQEAKAKDVWAQAAEAASVADASEDLWGAADKAEAAKKEAVASAPVIDADLLDIEPLDPEDVYLAACQTLLDEREVVEGAIATGRAPSAVVREVLAREGGYAAEEDVSARAAALDRALETVLPTRFALYEDRDPRREALARKLFLELFQEAETLKVVLVKSKDERAKVQSALRRAARYGRVDPLRLHEVELRLGELDAAIAEDVVRAVRKCRALCDSLRESSSHGIRVAGGPDDTPLQVLLFGNSSSLPIVHRKVLEVFRIDPQNVVMDRTSLKSAVARGACEEHALRQAFGEQGLIRYEAVGFLDRLPYALGLRHRDLGLVGYKDGFCPVFERGTKVGAEVVLSSHKVFLVHRGVRELAFYADHKDGAEALFVGFVDMEKPSGKVAPEALAKESVPEAPMAADAGGDASGPAYRLKVTLKPNREVRVTCLERGLVFDLTPPRHETRTLKNPLSGLH